MVEAVCALALAAVAHGGDEVLVGGEQLARQQFLGPHFGQDGTFVLFLFGSVLGLGVLKEGGFVLGLDFLFVSEVVEVAAAAS